MLTEDEVQAVLDYLTIGRNAAEQAAADLVLDEERTEGWLEAEAEVTRLDGLIAKIEQQRGS